MKEITLELWNINVKIGDLDDLKENSTIEKGKKDWSERRRQFYFCS